MMTTEEPLVTLRAAADTSLVRPGGSRRHIDFHLRVGRPEAGREREPVRLALVIDRSGSMSGEKLETAKKATLAVLERLGPGDAASVTVFDAEVEIILPTCSVTPENLRLAREALGRIEARSTTALHEGWLTGCRSVAADSSGAPGEPLARCFLLTDGLANVGETDPERIAEEAAGIRKNAGIGTSTFGIGTDYDEGLLGPMAVAGGGQFHHLRSAREIASTFGGELAEIMNVAARSVRLEVELDGTATTDLISDYWVVQPRRDWTVVEVGDLMAGEERHLVLRVSIDRLVEGGEVTVRARALWSEGGEHREGAWQELRFRGSSDAACDAQPRDRSVLHWVGLHHALRAERLATDLVRRRDAPEAVRLLRRAAERLGRYAEGDPELEAAHARLRALAERIREGTLTQELRRETRFSSQRSSRGQRDLR